MPEAWADPVRSEALVKIIADHVDDQRARAVSAYGMLSPDEILTERRPAGGETVDPATAAQLSRQPSLQGIGERHHSCLDIGIADDGEDGGGIVASIVLIVDEAGIVDAATIDVVHVPAGGMEEVPV